MGAFSMLLHICVFLASLAFLVVVIVLIGPALESAVVSVVNVVNPVLLSISGVAGTISQEVRSALQTAEAFLVDISDQLSSLIQTGVTAGFQAITTFSNVITEGLLSTIDAIGHAISFITSPIKAFFDQYIAPIVGFIVQSIGILGTFLTRAVNGLDFILNLIDTLPNFTP